MRVPSISFEASIAFSSVVPLAFPVRVKTFQNGPPDPFVMRRQTDSIPSRSVAAFISAMMSFGVSAGVVVFMILVLVGGLFSGAVLDEIVLN